MNVLVISPMPPEVDGLAPYAANLCAAYRRAGHEVDTIDTGRAGADSVSATSLRLSAFAAQIRLLRRRRPGLVHIQHTISAYGVLLPMLWTLVVAARLLGACVVVTHHEVTRDIARLKLAGRLYYGVVSRLADAVHVHTQESAATLQQRARVPAHRIVVFPHPVFVDRSNHQVRTDVDQLVARQGLTDRQILLHFGFIHVEKGIDHTIVAYAELLGRRPDLRSATQLVIAGDVRPRPAGFARFEEADHAYAQQLHDLVTQRGIEENVDFVGRVDDEDVALWMRAAAVVLLPYDRIEQSGVANLAVAAGTPVLATPLGGLAELLTGLPMIENREPGPYSELLEAALGDLTGLRQRALATYGRARQEGSVDQLAARVLDRVAGSGSAIGTSDGEAA